MSILLKAFGIDDAEQREIEGWMREQYGDLVDARDLTQAHEFAQAEAEERVEDFENYVKNTAIAMWWGGATEEQIDKYLRESGY